MTLDNEPTLPNESSRLPPARRRRARRALIPASDDERTALLSKLAGRAFPSFEFFLFSFLCGTMLGAGYIFNSPGLLVMGALLAPLLTPWVGMALATIIGSLGYFLQTLGSLLVGGVMILLTGILAGFAARPWMPLPFEQAVLHARLWWPDLIIVALGAVLLVVSFIRSESRPVLPSVMLAYELYLPLGAAGFGLGSGEPGLWPQGLLVLAVHLSLATLLGLLSLAILRFRPLNVAGYLMGGAIILLSLSLLVALTGLGTLISDRLSGAVILRSTATPTPAPLPSVTPTLLQTVALSQTPSLQKTATPTLDILPTNTPTDTPTPEATPIYAVINAIGYTGANIREAPGFNSAVVIGLPNGSLVSILPETATVDGSLWIHVYIQSLNRDGWVLQSVLITATPSPNW